MTDAMIEALKPYGYDAYIATIAIWGPGNQIVVYMTKGDFYVACLSHDNRVIWNYSCGGTGD